MVGATCLPVDPSYGKNALENLLNRNQSVEDIFGRNLDKYINTGLEKTRPGPEPSAGDHESKGVEASGGVDGGDGGESKGVEAGRPGTSGNKSVRFADDAAVATTTSTSTSNVLVPSRKQRPPLPAYGPGAGGEAIRVANAAKAKAAGQKSLQSQSAHLLRLAAARLFEGNLLCEWGCRTWVTLDSRLDHEQTECVRRVYECRLRCGLYVRLCVTTCCGRRPAAIVLRCVVTALRTAQHAAQPGNSECDFATLAHGRRFGLVWFGLVCVCVSSVFCLLSSVFCRLLCTATCATNNGWSSKRDTCGVGFGESVSCVHVSCVRVFVCSCVRVFVCSCAVCRVPCAVCRVSCVVSTRAPCALLLPPWARPIRVAGSVCDCADDCGCVACGCPPPALAQTTVREGPLCATTSAA
mgnify:CR=1 FL=1